MLLSGDLLSVIYSFSTAGDVARCAAVSHTWRAAATASALWTVFYHRRWGPQFGPTVTYTAYRTRATTYGRWVGHKPLRSAGHSTHTSSVEALAFTGAPRAGLRLLSGSRDTLVQDHKIDPASLQLGEPCVTYSGHTDSVWCAIAADDCVFTGAADATIRVWDRESGAELRSLTDHFDSVFCLDTSANLLASGSWDCRCILRSRSHALATVATLEGHTDAVWRLQIAEEHARLLTGSWDGWCCMWDLNTQALVDRYPGDSAVLCACLKPEEREIWALNREGVLLRWDTREPPAAPQTWDVPHCSRFAFADTSLCVCGFGGGGGVCVYDMRRFSPEKEPLVAFPSPEGGQGKDVISLAVCSPAPTYGPALLAAGYFSGHVALWAFK